ncbi:MAG TPA: hypothetical protein DD426_00060, partial [Clostridiaceae bacterium]|nr:hypothetical protein [Clostridiaceae bacterium]
FLLTYMPELFSQITHISLPSSFKLIVVLFIFAANYLGELHSYYNKIWWWDIFLHTSSGIFTAFAGFLIVYIKENEQPQSSGLNFLLIALFALSFAVLSGTLWEIYEFLMDKLFGLNMQRGSLTDTMTDLIADTSGGLLTSVNSYVYMKYCTKDLFKKMTDDFLKLNRNFYDKLTNSNYKSEAGSKYYQTLN